MYTVKVPQRIEKIKVDNLMLTLNEQQRKIVMHVLHCFKTNNLPVNVFLSGSAGVGKTLVINTLYNILNEYFDSIPGEKNDHIEVLLCAFSG